MGHEMFGHGLTINGVSDHGSAILKVFSYSLATFGVSGHSPITHGVFDYILATHRVFSHSVCCSSSHIGGQVCTELGNGFGSS